MKKEKEVFDLNLLTTLTALTLTLIFMFITELTLVHFGSAVSCLHPVTTGLFGRRLRSFGRSSLKLDL